MTPKKQALQPLRSARVGRTLLSVAFDLDVDFDLDLNLELDTDQALDLEAPPIPTAARTTVEERSFSAASSPPPN